MVYNVAQKTKYFRDLVFLNGLTYFSFACIRDYVIVTGGLDYDNESGKNISNSTHLLKIPRSNEEICEVKKGADMNQRRCRHSMCTDGMHSVFAIGSFS